MKKNEREPLTRAELKRQQREKDRNEVSIEHNEKKGFFKRKKKNETRLAEYEKGRRLDNILNKIIIVLVLLIIILCIFIFKF